MMIKDLNDHKNKGLVLNHFPLIQFVLAQKNL
jgi:hypothetical protein